MKKYKKIITGLLVFAIVSSFLSLFGSQKALAASALTSNDFNNAEFYMSSVKTIDMRLTTGSYKGQIINFTTPINDPAAALSLPGSHIQYPVSSNDASKFCGGNPFINVNQYKNNNTTVSATLIFRAGDSSVNCVPYGYNPGYPSADNLGSYHFSSLSQFQQWQKDSSSNKYTGQFDISYKSTPPTGDGSGFTDSLFIGANFSFVDGSKITATLPGSSGVISFVDTNPLDQNGNFAAEGGKFCKITNDGFTPNITLSPKDADRSQTTINLTFQFTYYDITSGGGGTCKKTTVLLGTVSNPAPSLPAETVVSWVGQNAKSLTSSTTLYPMTSGQEANNILLENADGGCQNEYAIWLNGGDNAGTLYHLSSLQGAATISIGKQTFLNCKIDWQRPVKISDVRGASTTPKDGAGGGSSSGVCEASYKGAGDELNWISCVVLRAIDGIIGTIYNLVEGQLFFCTGQSDTTGGTCNNNLLPNDVKSLWSVFRNLTSGLLVIIMLVMVLSQAFGGGLMDAYTVKKVLPRLVIAAIAMQLSWYIFKWFIDLSNDLGRGIADLMYYPFGGPGNFDLDNLLGRAGNGIPTLAVAGTALTTTLLIAFAGFTPFGFMLIGLGIIASLLIGLFVLLFRQILIILCMVLAPLALLAWILPGTQKYFKLWQENFTKLLMMFPMIVAMIAAGRIFAFVGSQSNTGFISMLVILMGVFGPLFFLPKTFKWGGTAFGAIANGIWDGTKKARGWAPGKTMEAAKFNREQRAQDRNTRLAENRSSRPFVDKLLAGKYNMALGEKTRMRKFEANRAQGRKASEEATNVSIVGSAYEEFDHPKKLVSLTAWAQGDIDTQTGLSGADPILQRWALDELAKYGDWDIISNLRAKGKIKTPAWEKFVSKNISGIHQNAPHLSPQRTDLSVLGYEEVAQWKDFEITEARRQLEGGFKRDVKTGGEVKLTGTDRLAHLQRWYNFSNDALGDMQVMRGVSTEGKTDLEAMRAYAAGQLGASRTNVEVRQGRGPGATPQVELPANYSNPISRRNITGQLASFAPSDTRAIAIRTAMIERVIGSPKNSPEETEFIGYMHELRDQAQSSPVAKGVYNSIVQQFDVRIKERELETEQQSLAVGRDPDEIIVDLTQETNHALDKDTRIKPQIPLIP